VSELTVIVQTCPERIKDGEAEATFSSLRASDIGNSFRHMVHPEGIERCRFFRSVLVEMARAPTPYVIRCEDDIIVNEHIAHNFLTWPALTETMFGCGWLYVSEMALLHETAKKVNGFLTRSIPIMYGSLCVGMPTSHAQACVDLLDEWIEKYGCPLSGCARGRRCSHATRKKENIHAHGQDTLISQAIWRLGKRVYYPLPVLAENRLVPSVRGTGFPADIDLRHLRAGPRFNQKWRR